LNYTRERCGFYRDACVRLEHDSLDGRDPMITVSSVID